MAGREERAPRPERDHPVGKSLYNLSRSWGVAFGRISAGNPTVKENEKIALLSEVDAIKAQIQAI